MTTLTIHVPDSKADFIKKLLKELDVKVEIKKESKEVERKPNAETIKAIEDAKKGKTTPITNIEAFFERI
jgi:hypothetical protein